MKEAIKIDKVLLQQIRKIVAQTGQTITGFIEVAVKKEIQTKKKITNP